MKPKKWKVTVYLTDDGEGGFVDAQVIKSYLAVSLDTLTSNQSNGIRWTISQVQELKA